MQPLTSIIIPTFNHASYVADAIASALAQTAPVEVIVVDDGSTDGTKAALSRFDGPNFRAIFLPKNGGVSAARNAGIEAARGGFLMFLDADDTIEPRKVEIQLAKMDDDAGWVLCDVRIDERSGRSDLASKRYDYAGKRIDGWLEPWLAVANFIPVH